MDLKFAIYVTIVMLYVANPILSLQCILTNVTHYSFFAAKAKEVGVVAWGKREGVVAGGMEGQGEQGNWQQSRLAMGHFALRFSFKNGQRVKWKN